MAQWDEHLDRQLIKDEENFEKLLAELRAETSILDKLEESLLTEVAKARNKVNLLINKLEKCCESSARHHRTLMDRNRVWRDNELRRIREEFANYVKPEPQEEEEGEPAFFTVDGIIKLVNSISFTDNVRATDFEALSYSFLFGSVLDRALKGDSRGYFLSEPLDIVGLTEEGATLLSLLRESYDSRSLTNSADLWDEALPIVRDWWECYALPKIFGGSDPDWANDECLPYDYMVAWLEERGSDPIYADCLDLIRRVKYGS